ncbi:MAG: hypothetical protein WAN50_05050 [Minisyncoccia bacterium]
METNTPKVPLEFTKDQYIALAQLVYLGNWMANCHRTGREDDPHLDKYNEIADYVFSLAPLFGLPKQFEHQLEYDPSGQDTEISRLIKEYDDEAFWDELEDRLGDRDFFNRYSEEEWKKMTQEERFMKLQDCIIKWEDEFEEYGISRLGIVEK